MWVDALRGKISDGGLFTAFYFIHNVLICVNIISCHLKRNHPFIWRGGLRTVPMKYEMLALMCLMCLYCVRPNDMPLIANVAFIAAFIGAVCISPLDAVVAAVRYPLFKPFVYFFISVHFAFLCILW